MNYSIDTDQLHEAVETWDADNRIGWRLYEVPEFENEDIFVLTKYNWETKNQDEIIDIGYGSITPVELDKETVNSAMKAGGADTLSEPQWQLLVAAYHHACRELFRRTISEGRPIISERKLYAHSPDWPNLLEAYIVTLEERADLVEKDAPPHNPEAVEPLNSSQRNLLHLVDTGVEKDDSHIPFVSEAQYAASLELEPLTDWQARSIELVHQGVFKQKPELAHVQAMRIEGYNKNEILSTLDISDEEFGTALKEIDDWEKRAKWTINEV